jgi:hypothetical protein
MTDAELEACWEQLSDDEIGEIERERRAEYAADQADMQMEEI